MNINAMTKKQIRAMVETAPPIPKGVGCFQPHFSFILIVPSLKFHESGWRLFNVLAFDGPSGNHTLAGTTGIGHDSLAVVGGQIAMDLTDCGFPRYFAHRDNWIQIKYIASTLEIEVVK